jgi:phenol/toluene 2-monooxygenase (NADH) P4/A4
MSVVANPARAAYDFPARDVRENFPAPLLFIGWEDHLMFASPFCLPLPPDTPFGALASAVLPGIYGYHPDFAKIDWSAVQWFKSGQPWSPDNAKTLAENGLKHKDAIRFRTPGLTGIKGSCS